VAVEPELVHRATRAYAGVRERLPRTQLADVVPRLLAEVTAFLGGHRIPAAGPALIRYLVVDYNTGDVEIEAGFPIDASALPSHGRVRLGQLPAGVYATVVHRGSYATLMATTAALLDWAKTQSVAWQVSAEGKVTRWEARVEHYLVGPPDEPDPDAWRTEIAILLAAPR
jgi:effector-binding domain-containing protein